MYCVYWNFYTIKIVLSWYKAIFLILKKCAYFSVTSITLNDINVRGGNVIKPFAREIGTSQNLHHYSRVRGNELENYGYMIYAC